MHLLSKLLLATTQEYTCFIDDLAHGNIVKKYIVGPMLILKSKLNWNWTKNKIICWTKTDSNHQPVTTNHKQCWQSPQFLAKRSPIASTNILSAAARRPPAVFRTCNADSPSLMHVMSILIIITNYELTGQCATTRLLTYYSNCLAAYSTEQ